MELYGFMEREKKIPSYFFIITKTDNTTLKKFYEKNYEKSDKTKDKDFLVSIVRLDDGKAIGDLL